MTGRKLVLSAGLASLLGCTTPGPTVDERRAALLDDPRVGERVEQICFSRQIDRFRDNGRDSVVLTRGASDEFLVIVRGCPLLDDAQGITLGGTGCLQDMGRLFVSDTVAAPLSGTPQRIDRCPVHAIYEWNADAIDLTKP